MAENTTGGATAAVPYEDSPYRRWLRDEGLTPLLTHHVPDLRTLEFDEWRRLGVQAKVIMHDDTDRSNDSQVVKIPAGHTVPQTRHLFDKMVYVMDGSGTAAVWNTRGDRQEFAFSQGAVFAVPMNAWHTITASPDAPALLVGVTNAPIVMNLYDDIDFVFDTPHDFAKRFAGEEGYFDGDGHYEGRLWNGNHVPDARTFPLIAYPERGAGGANVKLRLAKSAQWAHISQFPVGSYKKAHRHGPGANVIVLSGEGYTLMWKEGSPVQRYEWREGSLIVPPENWFHQHFNTGAEPARYLALRHSRAAKHVHTGLPLTSVSVRLGGDQIEYDEETPEVRATYLAELGRKGIELQAGTAGA